MIPGSSILLVEDDPQIRRFVRLALEEEGFRVFEAETLKRGMIEAAMCKPLLAIVDLGLPDGDGKQLITEVRSWSPLPILILSARDQEQEKVAALDAGADDYLTKPFGISEFLARIRALLRRQSPDIGDQKMRFGDVEVDLSRHELRKEDQLVHLTPIEFRLLAALLRGKGRVLSYRQLLLEVWGPAYVDRVHYLRVHMANLRRKIEKDPAQPRHLITELQVGYRLAGFV